MGTENWIGPYRVLSKFSKNPVATSLGLVVIYFLIFTVPSLDDPGRFGHGAGVESANEAANQLGFEVLLALSILIAILILGWAKFARLTTSPYWPGTVILIPPLLYVSTMLTPSALGDGPDFGSVLALPVVQRMILVTVLVGVFEELLFRGAVLSAFEHVYGVTVAIIVSSLIFGLMHYVNWVGGQSFTGTTVQVIHAAGSGLMYAAIVLITRSIWFSVAFHAFWDCSIFLIAVMSVDSSSEDAVAGSGIGGFIQPFLQFGVEPLYGLLLLWLWRRSINAGRNHRHTV